MTGWITPAFNLVRGGVITCCTTASEIGAEDSQDWFATGVLGDPGVDSLVAAAAGSAATEPGHDVEVRGAEDPGTLVAGPDPCASVPARDGWLARLA